MRGLGAVFDRWKSVWLKALLKKKNRNLSAFVRRYEKIWNDIFLWFLWF